MTAKWIVRLSSPHRRLLRHFLAKRSTSAMALTHAQILLKADAAAKEASWKDEEIARLVNASMSTIYRVRKRFAERGLPAALFREQRRRRAADPGRKAG